MLVGVRTNKEEKCIIILQGVSCPFLFPPLLSSSVLDTIAQAIDSVATSLEKCDSLTTNNIAWRLSESQATLFGKLHVTKKGGKLEVDSPMENGYYGLTLSFIHKVY